MEFQRITLSLSLSRFTFALLSEMIFFLRTRERKEKYKFCM